jgi:hypothetical protein
MRLMECILYMVCLPGAIGVGTLISIDRTTLRPQDPKTFK